MLNAFVERHSARFDPRGAFLAVGRSLLGLALLVVVAVNPDDVLFPGGPRCDGIRALGLWCVLGPSWPARVVAVVVATLVTAGFAPRWTCVPHWYVAFGFAACSSTANGGDRIAQITALLVVPLCLGDRRWWQWAPLGTPLAPAWRGSALAALLVLRVQTTVVYLDAAVSKLRDPAWRAGTALRVVFHDPEFGLPRVLLDPVAAVAVGWALPVLTWSVIAVQLVLAVAVPAGRRRVVLVLGLGLHAAIALLLGLPVFGLVMAGLLVCGCVRVGRPGSRRGAHG
ncbi:hypothetical protein [Actinosynnema sp. NPDC020468]|uniref:hypothetical protein n=1 Tax=Actinosynnema sp. NPDC020468 TaxID=3154488 RepID=UPI0033FCD81A